MALERGTLAKIDRRIFAELDHCAGMQLVKVPLPEAVWSTWRRYCQAIGLTMGSGIAGLINQELGALVTGHRRVDASSVVPSCWWCVDIGFLLRMWFMSLIIEEDPVIP